MRRKSSAIVLVWTLFLLFLSAKDCPVFGEARPATITALKGTVEVMKKGTKKWVKAAKGMKLSEGDQVRTKATSSCTISWDNDTLMKLTAFSNFTITQASYNPNTKQQNTNTKLLTGKIYNNVKKALTPGSSFEVTTPTAIVGVRSTMYSVEVLGTGNTNIQAKQGEVSVSAGGVTVVVGAGQKTTVEKDKAPEAPEDMSESESDEFDEEAEDIAGPLLIITSPAGDFETDSDSVTVSGTTNPGNTVKINGASVAVDASGKFSHQVDLKENVTVIEIVSQNTQGNTSSATLKITKNEKTGPSLNVASPSEGSVTAEEKVTVSGTTDAGASVTVNGESATVGDDGSFSKDAALAEGENTLTVVASKDNFSTTVARKVTYQKPAAGAPALTLTGPTDGIVLSEAKVAVTGKTDAGATVTVNGQSVTVSADGNFSKEITLVAGENTVTVVASNDVGSTTITRKVMYKAPGAPTLMVSAPMEGAVIPQAKIMVSGKTDSGAGVTVNGQTATVSADGMFSKEITLAAGTNTITVVASKNEISTTVIRKVTFQAPPPGAPVLMVTSPTEGSITTEAKVMVSGKTDPGALVTINGQTAVVSPDGMFSKEITLVSGQNNIVVAASNDVASITVNRKVSYQAPVAGAPLLTVTLPADGQLFLEPKTTVSGATTPGSLVTVNGQTVTVNADGSFTREISLLPGPNNISVVASNASGSTTVVRKVMYQAVTDTIPPLLTLSQPAADFVTNMPTVVVVGLAEAGATVTANAKSLPVSADGSFSTTLMLMEGKNTLTFVAKDAAGNSSTIVRNIVLDTLPPMLSISTPGDNSLYSTPIVPLVGITDPKSRVRIQGREITVQSDGSFTDTLILTEGQNNIKIESIDLAGNMATTIKLVTLKSVPLYLIVSQPPDFCTCNTNGTGTCSSCVNLKSRILTIVGITDPKATVTINQAPVYVDPGGNFTKDMTMNIGDNTIVISARDATGAQISVVKKVTLVDVPPIPPQ